MPITSHVFEAYLKCQTKCFLRSLNEPPVANHYSDWVQAQQASYLRGGIKRLTQGAAQNECITRPITGQDVQSATWRLAVESSARVQNLESTIQAVERLALEKQDNLALFTPIRFIFTNKLHRDDKLLDEAPARQRRSCGSGSVGARYVVPLPPLPAPRIKCSAGLSRVSCGSRRRLPGSPASSVSPILSPGFLFTMRYEGSAPLLFRDSLALSPAPTP